VALAALDGQVAAGELVARPGMRERDGCEIGRINLVARFARGANLTEMDVSVT
jgi:hypothetical protein